MRFNLAARPRGLVVAPAGCGKTQVIVDSLKGGGDDTALVLTHTNAGVAALRARLGRAGVAKTRYRLATIDGWALRLVAAFPSLAGLVVKGQVKPNYDALRKAAAKAVESGALDGPIRASYGRLIVDEYQDCCNHQHGLVLALADRLPTSVLGDPMQRIFDFRPGSLPDWTTVVCRDFPVVQTFQEPWRWTNAGERAFGVWVLQARADLEARRGVDLASAPSNVRWIAKPADANALAAAQRQAVSHVRSSASDGLLVIGDSMKPATRTEFARLSPGLQVVEPVDLKDLLEAAERIDGTRGVDRLEAVLGFAARVMTGVDNSALAVRLESLANGRARTPADDREAGCLAFLQNDDWTNVLAVLDAFAAHASHRIFRREVFNAMQDALRKAGAQGLTLTEASVLVREQRRATGKPMPQRAVGSTLLLKGLEAEHAVILDADAMNARHLYVALSRASKSLTVFSSQALLNPA